MIESESNSSVIIDVQVLENRLKNNADYWASAINPTSVISKVKKHKSENAYDPIVVSIGPYHHAKKTLQAMERKKWNWIEYILKINKKRTLRDYLISLKEVEHVARSYYDQEIEMDSNKFINMLLLDGFFILASLYIIDLNQNHTDFNDLSPEDNQMQRSQYYFVVHDLLLVENQIPFFILRILYELFTGEESTASSFLSKITHLVQELLPQCRRTIKEFNGPIDHFLHLCHNYLRPSQNDYSYFIQLDQDRVSYWRGAVQYHKAGVNFKKRQFDENNPHSFLDVRFANNMLEIPNLTIDENTSSLYKNLVALEQTSPKYGNDITAYFVFICHLVSNAKDVALLVSEGIVEHDLPGEEEVANFFTSIGEAIVFDFTCNFYLKNIFHNIELYYQSHMKWWNAWFRRTTLAIRDRI